jgi:hypothetical protein
MAAASIEGRAATRGAYAIRAAGTEQGGQCGVGPMAMTRLRRVRYGKSRPVREERRVGALTLA